MSHSGLKQLIKD